MCKIKKSKNGGPMYLTKMGSDVTLNGEDLSYRMRAVAEDGNTFDFHVDKVNKYSLSEDVGHLDVDSNYWYVDPYQVSDIVSVANVHSNHLPFTSTAEMLIVFNSISGYMFTEVIIREES